MIFPVRQPNYPELTHPHIHTHTQHTHTLTQSPHGREKRVQVRPQTKHYAHVTRSSCYSRMRINLWVSGTCITHRCDTTPMCSAQTNTDKYMLYAHKSNNAYFRGNELTKHCRVQPATSSHHAIVAKMATLQEKNSQLLVLSYLYTHTHTHTHTQPPHSTIIRKSVTTKGQCRLGKKLNE